MGHPILRNFDEFIQTFSVISDDPNDACTAKATLQFLQQGHQPVSAHAVHFQQLVTNSVERGSTGLPFQLGVINNMKDELAQVEPPTSLDSYITLCLQIGSCLFKRQQEKKRLYRQLQPGPVSFQPSPQAIPRAVVYTDQCDVKTPHGSEAVLAAEWSLPVLCEAGPLHVRDLTS